MSQNVLNAVQPRPDESMESEIIEVDVKAHKRVIIRSCMRKDCSCKGVPNTVTAPMPPKVIPKSPYGISIWETVLLNYQYFRNFVFPIHERSYLRLLLTY